MNNRLMKVLIFGAGVSGISCAHELLKKTNAKIKLHEKLPDVGGMARSEWDKKLGVYTEHSWRGYAPFYSNMFSMLKDIPEFPRMFSKPLNFILPKTQNTSTKPIKFVDKLDLAPDVIRSITSCEKRNEKYARQNVLDTLAYGMTEAGKDAAIAMLGPGLGLNPHKTSVYHLTKYLSATYEPGYAKDGARFTAREAWSVANGPTNEAVLYPWIDYLAIKYGDRFELKTRSELSNVSLNSAGHVGSVVVNGEVQVLDSEDTVVLALGPFDIPKVITPQIASTPQFRKIERLTAEGPDEMPSFRVAFSRPINFEHSETVVALPDSAFNLTLYPQMRFWDKRYCDTMRDRGVYALWSGTVCVGTERPGSLHNKTAVNCSLPELKEEIVWQIAQSNNLNERIKRANDGKSLRDFLKDDLIFVEIWNEWKPGPDGKLVSDCPKWATTCATYRWRPSQRTEIPGLVLCGAHTKTSMDIWSMEGATESGKLAAKEVIREAGGNPEVVEIFTHNPPPWASTVARADAVAHSMGLPHILDVIVMLIMVITIYLVMSMSVVNNAPDV